MTCAKATPHLSQENNSSHSCNENENAITINTEIKIFLKIILYSVLEKIVRLRFVAIINKIFGWLQPLSGVLLSHNVYATASEMHVMENH